jgi:hypothetical protein
MTRRLMISLAALAVLALAPAIASAATLVQYTFDTVGDGSGSDTQNASTVGSDVSASAFTHSITASPAFNGAHGGPISDTPSLAVAGDNTNWTTDDSLDPTKFFTFTLTVDAGFAADLTALTFYSNRNSQGPTAWAVRSSLDAFAADLASGPNGETDADLSAAAALRTVTLNLSSVTGSIEFRIYAFDAGATTQQAFRIDDITLDGATAATGIPTPAALPAGLILLSAIALLRRRRSPAPAADRP